MLIFYDKLYKYIICYIKCTFCLSLCSRTIPSVFKMETHGVPELVLSKYFLSPLSPVGGWVNRQVMYQPNGYMAL